MQKLKRKLRDVIRDSPRLYTVFLKLYLGKQLKLPTADTDCHLTGFPRSANTYSHYLAKGVFPEFKFITHVHTIASLQVARKLDVPVAIIYRNPVDCVISMCLKYKKESTDVVAIDGYFYDYIHYHQWILQHLPDTAFFQFEDVTKHSKEFITKLAAFLNKEVDSAGLESRLSEIKSAFNDREKLKDPDGSSLPQQSRIAKKAEFNAAVKKSALFEPSMECYRMLKDQLS
jgi:hypothetical protein